MTIQEAKYLLENTAWLAPSLEPIDEAIEMACDALDKVEYINSQLGKVEDEPTISKMEQVDEPQTDCPDCKYDDGREWYEEPCGSCWLGNKQEPKTDCPWK